MYQVSTDEASYGVQVCGNKEAADRLVDVLVERGRTVTIVKAPAE